MGTHIHQPKFTMNCPAIPNIVKNIILKKVPPSKFEELFPSEITPKEGLEFF